MTEAVTKTPKVPVKKAKAVKAPVAKSATSEIGEVRQFRMHPDLLYSVIKAQAGTHEKALLEAVMNAVDAGATQCEIEIDQKGYVINDNGKGFASREEIEDFFETFGTPHKEGDATYGKFRMGRGQLFAFSRTVWQSNNFLMDVCIKTKGLDYLLKDDQPVYSGCKITGSWHEKLKSYDVINISRELKTLIRYMQIPIILNGENISCLAHEQKWDAQTPEAYIKVSQSAGALSVYNLGALVCHYPASKFGIGGIVVAKEQLTVNFARNDVLVSECKVWKKISKKLNEFVGLEVQKKTTLSDSERIAIVNGIISGKFPLCQYMNKGLLLDVTSKKPTFTALMKAERIAISTGNYETRNIEEKIHDQGLAFVLDHSMLDRFMVNTAEEFVEKINEMIEMNNDMYKEVAYGGLDCGYRNYNHHAVANSGLSSIHQRLKPTLIPIETLIKNFNSSSTMKDDKKLSKKEKCMLVGLESISGRIASMIDSYLYNNKYKSEGIGWMDMPKITQRKITIGVSEVADAWTDGMSYIAVSDRIINRQDPHELVYLMLHEYCHNEATNETHSHPHEFHIMFHDILRYQSYSMGITINYLATKMLKQFTKAGIKASGLDNAIDNMEKLGMNIDNKDLVE